MASGMTYSTAKYSGEPCGGSYREDKVGLRPLGACAYAPQPNFGSVEVDWASRTAELAVRDAASGAVAKGQDGSTQLLRISLDTCQRV